MPTPSTLSISPAISIRQPCPPAACECAHVDLLTDDRGDHRILHLTRPEERVLLDRLEKVSSLTELRRMQQRLQEQLGVTLIFEALPGEVRTVRGGLDIQLLAQPGLCRKTREAVPRAIRRALEQHPQIVYDLLHEGDLFGAGPA